MYRPDFADYTPWQASERPLEGRAIQCIGWLDRETPFSTGSTPELFHKRLVDHCIHGIFHVLLSPAHCSLCAEDPTPLVWPYDRIWPYDKPNQPWINGQIFVTSGAVIYTAPTRILHYIDEHGYRPPDAFIEAVINGPLATSAEHQELMRHIGLKAFTRAEET